MSNLAGTTWVFNDELNFTASYTCETSFIAGTVECTAFYFSSGGSVRFEINSTYSSVYESIMHWRNDANGVSYKTITFLTEPNNFSEGTKADFIIWLEANATQQGSSQQEPNQYYITNDLELKGIADAIRTKLGRDANTLGKNLLNPETMIAYIQPNTTYTLSVTVTWDGEIDSLGGFNKYFLNNVAGGGFFETRIPPPAAGTIRETTIINTGSNCYAIKINFNEDLNPMDAQLELGDTATEYEPYTSSNLLSYPTDFTNKILNTANLVHVNGAMSEYTYYPSDTNKTILQSGTYIGANQIVAAVQHLNLEAANIKAGTNVKVYSRSIGSPIYNITGTYTSDADATAADILSGKTAYVNGEKITGTYSPNISSVNIKTGTVEITPNSDLIFRTSSNGVWNLVSHPIDPPQGTLEFKSYSSGTYDGSTINDVNNIFRGYLSYSNGQGKLIIQTKADTFVVRAGKTLILNFDYYDIVVS